MKDPLALFKLETKNQEFSILLENALKIAITIVQFQNLVCQTLAAWLDGK